MSNKNAKVEQGEATLKELIDIAREMFSKEGYANVSTTEIVKAAGVTRGALYHHFDGKESLFRAVFEDVQAGIGARILQAVEAETEGWQQLISGCEAFFRASLDPAVQQIVMIDAPGVLGRDVWRQIDEEATTSLLLAQLDELVEQGVMQIESSRTLAHMLAGAMNEAVLYISESEDEEATLQEVMKTLVILLEAFKI